MASYHPYVILILHSWWSAARIGVSRLNGQLLGSWSCGRSDATIAPEGAEGR
jgi:hypothetical protein